MANSETGDSSERRFRRGSSAVDRLDDVSFPLVVRGYDRRAVDAFVDEMRDLVAVLESTQAHQDVVQNALDQVGMETAGILQRAHEAADELVAQSRAEAEARVDEAEREAEALRRAADEYSEQVVVDTRLLWDERQRLIEDARQLADEVLATADEAMERVKMPEPLSRADLESGAAASEERLPGPVVVPGEPSGPRAVEPGDEPRSLDYATSGEDTAAYALGAVEDEYGPAGDEQSGHTVELAALPGGATDDPYAGDETFDTDESYEGEAESFEPDTDSFETEPRRDA